MKVHTRIYLKFFGYGEQDFIYCEGCKYYGTTVRANDIHHIEPRGMGGSKKKDFIENLLAVCRGCHEACENGLISKEKQKEIHEKFMEAFGK